MFNTNLFFNNGSSTEKQFVAVARASSGGFISDVVMTSKNGISWNTQNVPAESVVTRLESIAWSPTAKIWVAGRSAALLGQGSPRMIYTSYDAVSWTQRDVPYVSNSNYVLQPYRIIWVPEQNKFYAAGLNSTANGYHYMSSPDGITWTMSFGDTSSAWFNRGLAYSPSLNSGAGRFYSNRSTGGYSEYSNNFTSWPASYIGLPANAGWRDVIWVVELSKFIQVSDLAYGAQVPRYSSDGINWSSSPSQPESINWTSLAWSPNLGMVVAVASSGTKRVMYTYDGINWSNTSVTGAGGYAWNSVCWSPELNIFVAVGDTYTMSSTDGINWAASPGSLPGGRTLTAVTYGGY